MMIVDNTKATNLHVRRNKHIWKLVFFLEKIVIISKKTWNASKHINHGSCQKGGEKWVRESFSIDGGSSTRATKNHNILRKTYNDGSILNIRTMPKTLH